ncbi:MAG: hypothetical protein LBS34_00380 [Rickettsiales bacterium]|jgi:hypothetical protein|nr:hypothetical protein [Rickettsiales bacterium]
MKKCIRTVFVSLLVVLTMGKSVWASSKGVTGAQAMEYLKQMRGCIAFLTRTIGTDKELERQGQAQRNLEKASRNPHGRPILERAFEDEERESRSFDFVYKQAEEIWWKNLYAIKKMYLSK